QGKCSLTTSQRCSVTGDCPSGETCDDLVADPTVDPVPAAVLDGKILFNTAARDASVTNGVGLGAAAPRFDDAAVTGKVPGSVVSTSHDASYVTCSTCHADFGGQDGRTWDFSQFGASLRNTMDLRGRPGFSPGTCSNDTAKECFFDAACDDDGGTPGFCRMNPQMIPPNVPAADRDRYFNPMLTVHWNGDRDEVEDFEHTFRSLMGCGDCDSAEDVSTCQGCLIQRDPLTSTDPADVHDDLGAPNRNIPSVRHDVGTMNLFDAESPLAIAQMDQVFQNPRVPIPGARGPLGDYLTPVLNDIWNTAPYLHDGSAHTLLDVVRPCD